MFRPLEKTTTRWAPLDGVGLEHLHLEKAENQIIAQGVTIGERGGVPYGATYRVLCDPAWHVREFYVALMDGRQLHMRSDGEGHWHFGDGSPAPEFDGCIDIDLAATPFTNTLPIRRTDLRQAESREFSMLYVPFNTLTPIVDRQIYTCRVEHRLYRYEASDRTFTTELPVDADGLVGDYPTLFRRVI